MSSDVTVTFGGDSSALRSVLNQAGNDVNNFGNTVGGAANGGGATGMISGLQGAINMLLGPLEQFASRAASIAETFLLWTGMRKMTDEIAAMADGFFDLNNQLERNQYAWKYLFGGGAEGTATAQRLADWTKTASLTIPFTRQDMMSGISSLGTKLDEGSIEKYMPLVSDMAATMGVSAYGGRGMNLQQTSQAMIWAMEGNWRMMRELKVQEKDLEPFGFKKHDGEATFFPALQAWAKHKGIAGASKDIADNTWFGMWSSFIDRIQNFQLDTGGSMFKTMKHDLKDLTDWIDGHHAQIEQFANTLGSALVTGVRLVATGVADFAVGASGGKQQGLMGELGGTFGAIDKDGLLLIQGLLGGLQKADVGAGLSTLMKAIQDCLKDKTIQEGLKTLGGVIGMTLGTGLALAANLLAGLVHVIQFIADHQQTLDLFQSFLIALAVIAIPPLIAEMAVLATEMVIATWPFVLAVVVITAVIFAIKELHDHWGDIMTALGNLGSTIGNWIGDLATHAIGWGLTLVNNFLSTFIPKPVLDAVEKMGIGKVFQTIIDAAKQWGGDMISNFADGAKKFWDHTGGAIFNGIGNAIGAIFKHSVPHEGPMAGDDLWMEHFADNLTTGFQRGTPRLLAATMGTAASIAGTFTGLGGAGATMMGGTVSTSYGGSSLSIYGADSFAIRQIIQQELAQQDQLAALQTRRPGGFRRPGGIGY